MPTIWEFSGEVKALDSVDELKVDERSFLIEDFFLDISDDDDILVGAPEGSEFYVSGMGGVLLCRDGKLHPKQTRLGGIL